MKVGVLGEHLELFVEDFKRFLRNLIGLEIVDGDLHVIEPGLVEALDAVGHKEVAVGDHAGDGAVVADAADDVVELGVQEGFATGDGDDSGAEPAEMIDALPHLGDGGGLGDVVELVAISAGEIAAAHGHNVRHIGMRGVGQR